MVAQPNRRADFGHALVHLTRERREFTSSDFLSQKLSRVVSPYDVLKEILASGTIRGSGNEGYIKGSRRAVCFSEIPLASIHQFAAPMPEPGRYRYYGIALSKQTVFEAGGRPVIYLPDAEGEWIPAEEKWRHVRFEHGQVDFTHEREWRLPGDLDLKTVRGMFVIVWSAEEAQAVAKSDSPLTGKIRGVLPMEYINMML